MVSGNPLQATIFLGGAYAQFVQLAFFFFGPAPLSYFALYIRRNDHLPPRTVKSGWPPVELVLWDINRCSNPTLLDMVLIQSHLLKRPLEVHGY